MRRALYRKYRPKKLSEVVGQQHITDTLENALKTESIRHAYLFTGPRGVGKTSVARILSHEINKLPYSDDSTHLDIIEIDAASNRRIDEIRDLRDKVNIAPTSAKFKVYIIDEVHMLTKEAFNALLKTLEEPPEHVVFILATTETHKVPATIISRTQRFPFRQVSAETLKDLLAEIAKKESIDISDKALTQLAEHSDGSVRDALSLIDQLSAYDGTIDESVIELILGLPSEKHISQVIEAIKSHNPVTILESVQVLRVDGIAVSQFTETLSQKLRSDFGASSSALAQNETIELLQQLLLVNSYDDPMAALEIALLGFASSSAKQQPAPPKAEPVVIATPTPKPAPQTEEPKQPEPVPTPAPKPPKKTPQSSKDELSAIESAPASGTADWQEVLNQTKSKYSSLYGLLRMAETNYDGSELKLLFKFPFHAKQLKQSKNFDKLQEAMVVAGFGNTSIVIEVNASMDPPEPETSTAQPPAPDESINAISNIFGEVELLD